MFTTGFRGYCPEERESSHDSLKIFFPIVTFLY